MKEIVWIFGVMFNEGTFSEGTLTKVVQDLESLVNKNRSKQNVLMCVIDNGFPHLYYNWMKRIEKLRRTINAYHMKQSILVKEETTSAIKSIIQNREIVLFSGVLEGQIHHSFKAEELGSTVCAAIDVSFILKYQMPLNNFELVHDENVQKGKCIVNIKLTNGAMNKEEIEKVLREVIGACGIEAVISIDE